MPIVTDPSPRSQQAYGKFKPKSDLSKFGVAWAAVGGSDDSRYPSLDEITNIGEPIGTAGRSRLKYEVATFDKDGKTHDIKVGGVTLREVRVPIAELREAQKMSATESDEMLRRFQKAPENNRTTEVGDGRTGLEVQEHSTSIQDSPKTKT